MADERDKFFYTKGVIQYATNGYYTHLAAVGNGWRWVFDQIYQQLFMAILRSVKIPNSQHRWRLHLALLRQISIFKCNPLALFQQIDR